MARRDTPMKAADVFNESRPLFGAKVSFVEAFHDIADIRIDVTESGSGVDEWSKERTLGTHSTGEYTNCHNSTCYNGGVQIGSIVREMVRKQETERSETAICQRYEGSPKGRKRYRKCINFFEIRCNRLSNDTGRRQTDGGTSA